MNTFSFEREGRLVEGVELGSSVDDDMSPCEMSYEYIKSLGEEGMEGIMWGLYDVANDIFEYDEGDIIDTDITLVDDDGYFIWGYSIENTGDGNGQYTLTNFRTDDRRFKYTYDDEGTEDAC